MDLLENFDIIKIFFLTTFSFVIAILCTPVLTHFLYKYKLGKKIRDQSEAPVYAEMHQKKAGTPTMGGILIWLTVLILALLFWLLARFTDLEFLGKLNFLTRPQTLLPLGALVASALVGLVDDIWNVKGIGSRGGGIRIRYKLILYTLIALFGAYWFYFKLDWTTIHIPFLGNFDIGIWYVIVFIFIIVALWSYCFCSRKNRISCFLRGDYRGPAGFFVV